MSTMSFLISILVLISLTILQSIYVHATFSRDTHCVDGGENCKVLSDGLSLTLNQMSGALVHGNKEFLFGYVEMRIKLPPGNTPGVVTTFYMTSPFVLGTPNSHDEIDFEFLGNVSGQPNTIHTNVFVLGNGSREQQFKPWFDPAADFHSYGIFWNPYVIVWSVDGTVIRVFRNWESKGLPFANKQPMRVLCSIWNGDYWATENGQVKINWANAPFTSHYINYRADVCVISKGGNDVERCTIPNRNNWFVEPAYGTLRADQIKDLMRVRRDYMVYDYCTDTKRFNGIMPPECSLPIY